MKNENATEFTGDRALSDSSNDKLNFNKVAARIAISLLDEGLRDGFVVGIEGSWGSGKSSLLFLITEKLRSLSEDQKLSIINFRPWLIGNRNALLAILLGELSREVDAALNKSDSSRFGYSKKAREAKKALRAFMEGLSKTGGLIEHLGDASGLGPLKIFGKYIKSRDKILQGKADSPQLSVLKTALVESLRDLDHRFIVTIDDVDRLDPSEALEILRLVRSVADFPNVIYLLFYDRTILSESIEGVANIKSGQDYLEKIIQLNVMVPIPEPFKLRQWFSQDLNAVAAVKNEDELSRLKAAIDYEGGRYLKTPRSVVRLLDAVRFFWPSLHEHSGDLPDLIWIQLIKSENPGLYRWIEEYCGTAAALSVGIARVDEAERNRDLERLNNLLPAEMFQNVMYRHVFAEHLPGFSPEHGQEGDKFKIYEDVSEKVRNDSIRHKRLSSPDHYRLYFALEGPFHALTATEFSDALTPDARGDEHIANVLRELNLPIKGFSLTKADLLLDRIAGFYQESFTDTQDANFLIAFSQVMDALWKQQPDKGVFESSIWDRAERLIVPLLSGKDEERREPVIRGMFSDGAAIGWLTQIFRREIFYHGRFGDSARPDDQWLFTDRELDIVSEIILQRYRDMEAQDIFSCPDPLGILYAWMQGGREEEPRALVQEFSKSDQKFVDVLEHLMTTVVSSDRGGFKTLKEEDLKNFFDVEKVTDRVSELTNDATLGVRARRIQEAMRLAAEY